MLTRNGIVHLTALLVGSTASAGIAHADPSYVSVTPIHAFANAPDNNFAGAEGGHPHASLLEASDGKLYGTTSLDGPNMTLGCKTDNSPGTCPGTIFSVDRAGRTFTVVYKFPQLDVKDNAGRLTINKDGLHPESALTQGSDGYLYGTAKDGGDPLQQGGTGCDTSAQEGGLAGAGVAFKVKTDGTSFTKIHCFGSDSRARDGAVPYGALIQHGDGFVYGATLSGGADTNGNAIDLGVIYKVSTDGLTHATLHTFSALDVNMHNVDGAKSYGSPVFDDSSNLWGYTLKGGAHASGTIYKLGTDGTGFVNETDFCSSTNPNDVQYCGTTSATRDNSPLQNLIKGSDGNLYGVTWNHGQNDTGLVFKITPSGTFTVLHTFTQVTTSNPFVNVDGAVPMGTLVEGRDGNLYGTTYLGGANGRGEIFQVTKDGAVFVPLYSFPTVDIDDKNNEGAYPYAGLIQSVDGNFYGTSSQGGVNGFGTVYKMAPPLTFPAAPNAPLSTIVTSDTIYIAAVASSGSGSITISNGEYSIDAGAWTSAPGTISTGHRLAVRTTSASTYNTRVLATYTIGNQTAAFQVTTLSAP